MPSTARVQLPERIIHRPECFVVRGSDSEPQFAEPEQRLPERQQNLHVGGCQVGGGSVFGWMSRRLPHSLL